MKVRKSVAGLLVAAAVTSTSVGAQVFNGGLPAGYTCTASTEATACGTSGANGVVTLAPGGGSNFGWISSRGGSNRNPLAITGTINGTTLRSSNFSSTAGQSLGFAFNYITSDGAQFSDYAFVRLLSTTGGASITLFSARTTPSGNTVPGFGLPGLAPGVTLSPPSTPIIAGAPAFAPLGEWSGTCWSAGCGFTGWINASYTVPAADTYQLEFNVFNALDVNHDSALAFDFSTGSGGTPVVPTDPTDPSVVPEPSTYALMATGLIGLAGCSRRRRNTV